MHCPHCGADQPMGVTVCGFCGAVMARGAPALRRGEAEAIWRGTAQASRAARRTRRWLALAGAAAAVGLVLGWAVVRAGGARAAASPGAPADAATPPAAGPPATGAAEASAAAAAASPPTVVRGRGATRLDEDGLRAIAEELARLAAAGDAAELARRVDSRARYRLVVEDAGGIRELRGGKPELLAHWLAPWLAGETGGGSFDDTVEIERVAVEFDRRRGYVVRRIESAGDVSRLRLPRALLEPLAARGALDPATAEAVDFAPFRDAGDPCSIRETLRFAAGPGGLQIVDAERAASCGR